MSQAPAGLPPLCADDIAAMRAAEEVYFFRDCDGRTRIKVALPSRAAPENPRIYTARQQRLFPENSITGCRYRNITAKPSVTGYRDGEYLTAAQTELAQCHYGTRNAQGGEWQTIARAARAGDLPELRWKAGNDYPLITEAGLHRDELRLVLHREKHSPVFMIDALVRADGPARMIKL